MASKASCWASSCTLPLPSLLVALLLTASHLPSLTALVQSQGPLRHPLTDHYEESLTHRLTDAFTEAFGDEQEASSGTPESSRPPPSQVTVTTDSEEILSGVASESAASPGRTARSRPGLRDHGLSTTGGTLGPPMPGEEHSTLSHWPHHHRWDTS